MRITWCVMFVFCVGLFGQSGCSSKTTPEGSGSDGAKSEMGAESQAETAPTDAGMPEGGGQERLADGGPVDENPPEAAGEPAGTEEPIEGAAATVTLKGNVLDFVTAKGVPDVKVCPLDGTDPAACTKTDANGVLEMQVAANSLVMLRTERTGYQHAIMVFRTGTTDFSFPEFVIGSPALVSQIFSGANVTWDRKLGALAVHVDSDGVTPSIVPASGGDPFYIVNGRASRSSTGSPGVGLVLFANVDPGEVTLTLTHASKTCRHPSLPSQSGNDNVVKIPIRADHFTSLFDVSCK